MTVQNEARPLARSGRCGAERDGESAHLHDTTSRLGAQAPTRFYAGGQQLTDRRGRVVAEVVGGALVKHIEGSKHLLRQPPSIAFDVAIIAKAERLGASSIRVVDDESGDVYTVGLPDFLTHCFVVNRGFGDQRGLLLSRWEISRPGQTAAAPSQSQPEPRPAQLGFAW